MDAITRIFGAVTRDEEYDAATERRPHEIPSMKVLLAEDGQVNQLLAVKLLEHRGHTVVLAANGRQALGAIKVEKFDAVLMDLQMPEMDGFEATAAIRETEKRTGDHLPIIAMTANAMKGDRNKCLEAGMDDYIAKPVRSQELFATLERYAHLPAGASLAAVTTPMTDPEGAETKDQSAEDKVFDPRSFKRNAGDLPDLMRELIDLFDEESRELLSRIEGALEEGDAETLHAAAHSLKGMVGNFGARGALKNAERLNSLARHADLPRARATFPSLRTDIDRLREALGDYRERITG